MTRLRTAAAVVTIAAGGIFIGLYIGLSAITRDKWEQAA